MNQINFVKIFSALYSSSIGFSVEEAANEAFRICSPNEQKSDKTTSSVVKTVHRVSSVNSGGSSKNKKISVKKQIINFAKSCEGKSFTLPDVVKATNATYGYVASQVFSLLKSGVFVRVFRGIYQLKY